MGGLPSTADRCTSRPMSKNRWASLSLAALLAGAAGCDNDSDVVENVEVRGSDGEDQREAMLEPSSRLGIDPASGFQRLSWH